jgi:hypothetical protein
MHANQLAENALASKFIARCRNGFKNHFEWMGWRKKHDPEIAALPNDLKNAVCMAWENAERRR